MTAQQGDSAMPPVRRIGSAPVISSGSQTHASTSSPQQHQLWVACKPFASWGGGIMGKLPQPVARYLRESGVCHYLVIVKAPDGTLHSYDFGPQGGETTLQVAEVTDPKTSRKQLGAPGEIREEVMCELPKDALCIGALPEGWDLQAIRSHNAMQPTVYRLNENDCRHYVNNLVRKAAGVEAATAQLLQSCYQLRVQRDRQVWLQSLAGQGAAQADPNQDPTEDDSPLTRRARHAHSASAVDLRSLPSSDTAAKPDQPLVQHHSATAAVTLGTVLEHASCAISNTPPAPAAPTLPPEAAPLLMPLLMAIPAWDAPFVTIGQLLTHPNHWAAIYAMGQAAALSASVTVGARAIGASQAAVAPFRALPAVAGAARRAAVAVSATSPGPLRAWSLPRMMQALRKQQLEPSAPYSSVLSESTMQAGSAVVGRAANTVVGRIGTVLAPAAKALATQIRTRAAQVAAPLVAVAQSRRQRQQQLLDGNTMTSQQPQRWAYPTSHNSKGTGVPVSAGNLLQSVASGQSPATPSTLQSRLQLVLKGGLLPLPARSPRAAAGATTGVLACSGLALPAALQASPASPPPPASSQPARGWMRRRAAPTAAKPALLPAAALQAAVQPEGPSTAMVPRRGLLGMGRQARQPSMLGVVCSAVQQTQPPRAARNIFRLACNPLAWIGAMGARRSATGPIVIVPASAILSPTAQTGPDSPYTMRRRIARMWQWRQPARSLPPTAPASVGSFKLLEHAMQPLDAPQSLDIACVSTPRTRAPQGPVTPSHFALSSQLTASNLQLVTTTSQSATPCSLAAPATPSHALRPSISVAAPPQPVLLHMPNLPASSTGSRRRALRRRATQAADNEQPMGPLAALRRKRSMRVRHSALLSWCQQPSALVMALVVHAQSSRNALVL